MNREDWLLHAIEKIEQTLGLTIPELRRVSCGFAHGSRTAIGQCWSPTCSGDETTEIFISPALSDPILVLGTLIHEMIHAEIGVEKKHGREFKTRALELGLEGRMTATVVGAELRERLNELSQELGAYPHETLQGKTTGKPKDGIRQLKCVCPVCGYTIRTSQKWIEQGLPLCGTCDTSFVQEGKEG